MRWDDVKYDLKVMKFCHLKIKLKVETKGNSNRAGQNTQTVVVRKKKNKNERYHLYWHILKFIVTSATPQVVSNHA